MVSLDPFSRNSLRRCMGDPDLCRASVLAIGASLSKLPGSCVKVRNSESRFVYPVDSAVLFLFFVAPPRGGRRRSGCLLAGNEDRSSHQPCSNRRTAREVRFRIISEMWTRRPSGGWWRHPGARERPVCSNWSRRIMCDNSPHFPVSNNRYWRGKGDPKPPAAREVVV